MVIELRQSTNGEETYVMGFPRSLKRSAKHKRAKGLAAAVAAVCSIAVLTGAASGHQTAPRSAGVRAQRDGAHDEQR